MSSSEFIMFPCPCVHLQLCYWADCCHSRWSSLLQLRLRSDHIWPDRSPSGYYSCASAQTSSGLYSGHDRRNMNSYWCGSHTWQREKEDRDRLEFPGSIYVLYFIEMKNPVNIMYVGLTLHTQLWAVVQGLFSWWPDRKSFLLLWLLHSHHPCPIQKDYTYTLQRARTHTHFQVNPRYVSIPNASVTFTKSASVRMPFQL